MNDEEIDVFLSYNWMIKEQVKQLEGKLIDSGLKVWRDERYLKSNGSDLLGQIANAISNSKIFICFITEKYCKSQACNQEIHYANRKSKPIIVLMIENLGIDHIHLIKVNENPCGIGFIIK
jgi:hypothetical protein